MSFAITSDPTANGWTGGTVEGLVDRFGASPVTLLAVWAHPDDESYLGGGLMAEVARRGGKVISVTATLGEHGTPDPDRNPPQQLADRREAELARALDVLGDVEGHVLGYADGTCDQVSEVLGARRVGVLLDEIRPDLVLGFGSDGVTGHPDHRAVARWTRLAVSERTPEIPLFTTAAGVIWPADIIDRMHRVDAFWPGYPERTIDTRLWRVALEGRPLEQKVSALHSHASQIGALHDVLGPQNYRRLASLEAYRAANSAADRILFSDRRARAA